jgi:ELWxxDGT repeat protein
MRKIYSLALLFLIFSVSVNSQVFSLVKDIKPGVSDGIENTVNHFMHLNDQFLFIADDGTTGRELWKSDGTTAGTKLVKDINPGPYPFTSAIMDPLVIGKYFYFGALSESYGWELWRSDGTTQGTVMVKDINTTFSSLPKQFVSVGNTFYFSADNGANGRELWKSDGTAGGTAMVKDVNPGAAMSQPEYLTRVGNELYFTAVTAANGRELWKTDGTEAGTVLVKDVNPGVADAEIDGLAVIDNTVFFRAITPGEGLTLMKTNGTTSGTVVVKPGNLVDEVARITNVNGTVFFSAFNDQLWKSDGTAAGTVMLKDMQPAVSSAKGVLNIVGVNGSAFFIGNDPLTGRELWKSDGTFAGTVLVKDIYPGSSSSNPDQGFGLYVVGKYVLFTADDNISGREMWISDGTADGTYMMQDIFPGPMGSEPNHIIEMNGRIYISAKDPVVGRELWTACLCFKKNDIRDKETLVTLYPNPLRESGTLMVCVTEKEDMVYRIFDMSGRLVQTKKISLNNGSNLVPLQTSVLAAGEYIIAVDGKTTNKRLKFLKQ